MFSGRTASRFDLSKVIRCGLLLPGWEGNTNIKWLRRLNVADGPAMTTHETAFYTDLMPDGKARQFSLELEAKSVITRPAGGQKMPGGAGTYEITGLAWSGRGKIQRVEVSVDGKTWKDAELQQAGFTKAFTRFRMPWTWDGSPATLQSRATDDTGYLQLAPTRCWRRAGGITAITIIRSRSGMCVRMGACRMLRRALKFAGIALLGAAAFGQEGAHRQAC